MFNGNNCAESQVVSPIHRNLLCLSNRIPWIRKVVVEIRIITRIIAAHIIIISAIVAVAIIPLM